MDTIAKNASEKIQQHSLPQPERVSFIIEHRVKENSHEQYEDWLRSIIAKAAKSPGHLGVHVVPPSPGEHTYRIVVRFASRQEAEAWMNSKTRHEMVELVLPLIAEPEKLEVSSGIDYWFTAHTTGNRPPKRWKQWLTTVSVIWPLSLVLPRILAHLFRLVPSLGTIGVKELISALCMVGLLVYVIMPRYSKLLSKWLSR